MGSANNFSDEEAEPANNAVAAARRTKVKRIVYVGGLHPQHEDTSQHLKSRTRVARKLIDSGIETIAFQAGITIGAGSASFEMIRHLVQTMPVLPLPTWSDHLIQPIAIDDVLHYLVRAADAPVPTSRTWDIGGPNVLRYADVLREFAAAAGLRPRPIIKLPLLTPTLISKAIALLTPMPDSLVRPLVESLQSDAIIGDRDVDTFIAPPPHGLSTYRRALVNALAKPTSAGAIDTPATLKPTDPPWARDCRDDLLPCRAPRRN